MAKAKPRQYRDIPFEGGPKNGEKIRTSLEPMRWMKTGMPEWAVYELVDGRYVVRHEGLMARGWRNPDYGPLGVSRSGTDRKVDE